MVLYLSYSGMTDFSEADGGTVPTVADARRAAGVLPGSVLLFGSVGRGEAADHSDIDLMCVVDDVAPGEHASIELALSKLARRACGRRVNVVVADWPGWVSWKEWPSTLEHTVSQEGTWLKQQPPGADTDWTKRLAPQQIRAAAVASALNNTSTNLHAAFRDMGPDSVEIGYARGQEQEGYWDAVWARLGSISADLHVAVEQAFVVLCHLIGAPYSVTAHGLRPLYEGLKGYGLDDLDSWLGDVDLVWVEQWRSGGSYRADLARSEDTSVELGSAAAAVTDQAANLASVLVEDTVTYTRAVATISEAAVAIVEDRVSRSEVLDTEYLRSGINDVRTLVGLIYDRMSDRYWLYPDGTPPHGWGAPW